MKEFEKLLFEDTKRKEFEKALTEVKLGLFEQKKENTFDFNAHTLMTYGKKYKGLYDLYQNNETMELVFVCPLIENNRGDENERKDMQPYAYDVLYLEYLDVEAYDLVRKAAVHEKSRFIDFFYHLSIVAYFVLLALNLASIIYLLILNTDFLQLVLICGSLLAAQFVMTGVLLLVLVQYRKFKAQ